MITIAYDLETTGLSYKGDKIIEIGAVKYNAITGVSTSFEASILKANIPEEIQKLTGLNGTKGVTEKEAISAFYSFLELRKKPLIIGHNIKSFDNKFTAKALPYYKSKAFLASNFFDTMAIKVNGKARKSLKALAEAYKIKTVKPEHRALSDAKTAFIIYKAYRKQSVSMFKH